MPHDPKSFVGTWKLVDWRIEYGDGGVTRPFGEKADGYILYSDEGIMTASIARAGRALFDHVSVRNASDSEKAAAFDSYFHYAGHWHVDGDDVVHSVTMSLNPGFVGTHQVRHAAFDGAGGLVLSATEAIAGAGTRDHILQWQSVALSSAVPSERMG